MDMNSDPGLFFEADDDVFYAEIKRQILLLTTEEEDDDNNNNKVGFHEETKRRFNPNIVNNRGLNGSGYGPVGRGHFCCWEAQNCDGSAPLWLINLWKNGKGTGVFIPQVVTCKKNHISGRTNSRRKIYKPVMNKD